jgi:hypothetical protein
MSSLVAIEGGRIAPIIPRTVDDVGRLAKGIASSGLAPKGMDRPEQVMVAIMHGLELGLPPMQAVQRIAVINGRPTLWGDALPAILLSKGFKIREWREGLTAHCEVTRPDGAKHAASFSDANARKAGLWGKSGPWSQYPERMLQMRARALACRDGAADALSGLYTAEEVIDMRRDEPRVVELPTAETEDAPSEDSATDIAAAIRDAVNAAMVTHLVTEVYGEAIDAMGEEGRAIVEAAREEKMGQLGALV